MLRVRTFATSCRRLLSSACSHADIVIAGGSYVGMAMAASLSQNPNLSGLKVLLVERGKKPTYRQSDTYSNRVSALAPATVNFLKTVGAWDFIKQQRCQPVKGMFVWDGCSDSYITFKKDDPSESLAYIVENDVLLAALSSRLGANVEVQYEREIKSVSTAPASADDGCAERCRVELAARAAAASDSAVACTLLVGADGERSAVRHLLGMHCHSWDYHQMGLVATLRLTGVHPLPDQLPNCVAWQRFVPSGPIALLPLDANTSSLVWTLDTGNARRLLGVSDEHFIDELNDNLRTTALSDSTANAALRYAQQLWDNVLPASWSTRDAIFDAAVAGMVPTVVGVQSRAAFPFSCSHASSYVVPGVALVGDAAHRLHPLAGQGLNLGFGDVIELSRILEQAVLCGMYVGGLDDLKVYEARRQRAVLPMLLGIDGLNRLYTNSWAPVVLLRAVGLNTVQRLLPLKQFFMAAASG